MLFAEVMDVICGYCTQPCTTAQFSGVGVCPPLFGYPVVLHFKKEVGCAEDVAVLAGCAFGGIDFTL